MNTNTVIEDIKRKIEYPFCDIVIINYVTALDSLEVEFLVNEPPFGLPFTSGECTCENMGLYPVKRGKIIQILNSYITALREEFGAQEIELSIDKKEVDFIDYTHAGDPI